VKCSSILRRAGNTRMSFYTLWQLLHLTEFYAGNTIPLPHSLVELEKIRTQILFKH